MEILAGLSVPGCPEFVPPQTTVIPSSSTTSSPLPLSSLDISHFQEGCSSDWQPVSLRLFSSALSIFPSGSLPRPTASSSSSSSASALFWWPSWSMPYRDSLSSTPWPPWVAPSGAFVIPSSSLPYRIFSQCLRHPDNEPARNGSGHPHLEHDLLYDRLGHLQVCFSSWGRSCPF